MQLSFLGRHQEKCAICGNQFVPLSIEISWKRPADTTFFSVQFLVCSFDCFEVAEKRLKEGLIAKRKTDKWG